MKTFFNTARKAFYIGLAVSLALMTLGCAFPETEATQNATGSITIAVPEFAAWLTPYVSNGDADDSSRAVARSSSVKVIVTDASGHTVTEQNIRSFKAVLTTSSADSASCTAFAIPEGTDYTVSLSVYNNAVSATEPVASGTVTNVSVTAGSTTKCSIVCKPINPTPLTLETEVSGITLEYNGEAWYSIAVANGSTINFNDNGSNLVIGLFDSDGLFIKSGRTSVSYTATADDTLYIAVFNSELFGGVITGKLLASASTPVFNEGSVAAPIELTPDVAHTFKCGITDDVDDTSYYKFTADTAGTYAISLKTNYQYHLSVYADSGFTTNVLSEYTSTGSVGNLTAGTWYIKIENSYYYLNLDGLIVSDETVAANHRSDGTSANPVSLTMGTAKAGTIGFESYDLNSYYTFTTGASIDSKITLADYTGNGGVIANIGVNSGYKYFYFSHSYQSGAEWQFILQPNTVYYLKIVANPNETKVNTYTLTVDGSTPTINALSVADSWTAGEFAAKQNLVWYEATVESGKTYKLYVDQAVGGSGTYNSYAGVTTYKANRSTILTNENWSCYANPVLVTIPAGETKLFILVNYQWFYGNINDFAVKLVKAPTSGSLTITVE
jgi:hypothetical protein